MSIYDDMQTVAKGLLKEFDQTSGDGTDPNDGIWYLRLVPGGGPADNPGAPTETGYKVDGVSRGAQFKFVDGTTILQSDKQITLPVDTRFTYDIGSFIRVDGARYKIFQVDKVPPSGVTVANRIFARK